MGGCATSYNFALTLPGFEVFLPAILKNYRFTYTISGQVTDDLGQGIGAVTITTNRGQTAVTDANGNYLIQNLPGGVYSIAATKPGYTFTPLWIAMTLPPDAMQRNFIAIPVPTPTPTPTPISCSNRLINDGFEEDNGWTIGVTKYPAAYTTAVAHNGSRSMRVGIVNSVDNRFDFISLAVGQYPRRRNQRDAALLALSAEQRHPGISSQPARHPPHQPP